MSEEYPPEVRNRLYQRLNKSGKAYGVNFKRSDSYLANSQLALTLSEYAKKTAAFDRLHLNIFKAYFEDGKDIGNRQVLLQIAESSGLSRQNVEEAWQDISLRQHLQKNASVAHHEGATAVPIFIINDKYRIVGAQPYHVFRETLAKNK